MSRLARTAERLRRSKSEVVREAILDYSERTDRLTESERLAMLRAFDQLVPQIPARPQKEVDDELRTLRESRRHGGRLKASASR